MNLSSNILFLDVKTLDEEIVLAKLLLPTPAEEEVDSKSQTTEDLLIESPLQQRCNSEKRVSN